MRLVEPQLTGHLDGVCLRYGDEVIAVFPTLAQAVAALGAARAALSRIPRQPSPATSGR